MKKEFVIPALLAVVIGLGSWTLIKINALDSDMSAVQVQLSNNEKLLDDLKNNTDKIDGKLDKTEDKLDNKLDKVDGKVDQMRIESLKALNDIKLELAKSASDSK
ncbi:hypothetical protein NW014_002155 [Vibrio parahaemolyticus]|nr:hypothetical protein [Vibrio parahaemolyticus]